jgi:hypothetical protein
MLQIRKIPRSLVANEVNRQIACREQVITADIAARIDEGYAAAQRKELIDADAARSRLKELKQVRGDKTQRG